MKYACFCLFMKFVEFPSVADKPVMTYCTDGSVRGKDYAI